MTLDLQLLNYHENSINYIDWFIVITTNVESQKINKSLPLRRFNSSVMNTEKLNFGYTTIICFNFYFFARAAVASWYKVH